MAAASASLGACGGVYGGLHFLHALADAVCPRPLVTFQESRQHVWRVRREGFRREGEKGEGREREKLFGCR